MCTYDSFNESAGNSNTEKSMIFNNFNGLILINKEKSATSYDVIRKFKKVFF